MTTGWQAHCPAHDDNRASLSIREGERLVFLKCYAGCSLEAITEALGVRKSFLYHDIDLEPCEYAEIAARCKREFPGATIDSRTPLGRLVAQYKYTGTHGILLAMKMRFESKEFRWKRPDGEEGWTWRVPSAYRPLFHLHNVVDAQTICITEGEPDVLTLERAGFTATTAPDGAASWRPEFVPYFRGKEVIVVPDNDGPGIDYALTIEDALDGVARSVRQVRVPKVKDISDYAGLHGLDAVARLVGVQSNGSQR